MKPLNSLSIEQLAEISDIALHNAYHYPLSEHGANFGWLANVESATAALEAIKNGSRDIEEISDAVHKGWNKTAIADYEGTLKLDTPTPLERKQRRYALAQKTYAELPEKEKDKDRVVARALLKVLVGEDISS